MYLPSGSLPFVGAGTLDDPIPAPILVCWKGSQC